MKRNTNEYLTYCRLHRPKCFIILIFYTTTFSLKIQVVESIYLIINFYYNIKIFKLINYLKFSENLDTYFS